MELKRTIAPSVTLDEIYWRCCKRWVREILENGRYGQLVPVGDHEALARAMLEALDDPDNPCDKETRIKRAMEFSVNKAVSKYLEVLLGVKGESS